MERKRGRGEGGRVEEVGVKGGEEERDQEGREGMEGG